MDLSTHIQNLNKKGMEQMERLMRQGQTVEDAFAHVVNGMPVTHATQAYLADVKQRQEQADQIREFRAKQAEEFKAFQAAIKGPQQDNPS